MPVEHQVMIIYAATNGYLDDVSTADVRKFEHAFHEFMRLRHAEIGEAIRTKKQLAEDVSDMLKRAIVEFKETWASERAAA